MHNFFRRAHGPGWALVGDAALHRDPITAQGITNAFTHAAILAEELNQAFAGDKEVDTALADYDARQFDALKPMFDYTVHLAMLQPLPDGVPQMLQQAANDPVATGAFIGAFLGSVPLNLVFPEPILQLFADDVARGQQEVRLSA
jgi:2-polyprenyl-6-methoxyphenol hydroxylase-like FAD-dependent oxidoreductase